MKYKKYNPEKHARRFRVVGRNMYVLEYHSPTKARVVALLGDRSEDEMLGLHKVWDLIDMSPESEIELVAAA